MIITVLELYNKYQQWWNYCGNRYHSHNNHDNHYNLFTLMYSFSSTAWSKEHGCSHSKIMKIIIV